jgi:hypothetical protein
VARTYAERPCGEAMRRGYVAKPSSETRRQRPDGVTGRIGTGRAVRNREYQLDETRLGKEQIVNLSITYCKTIVN